MSNVGTYIRMYRKQKGITQKELANLCGVNEMVISRYELGKVKPKDEILSKISKALSTLEDTDTENASEIRPTDYQFYYDTLLCEKDLDEVDRQNKENEEKLFDDTQEKLRERGIYRIGMYLFNGRYTADPYIYDDKIVVTRYSNFAKRERDFFKSDVTDDELKMLQKQVDSIIDIFLESKRNDDSKDNSKKIKS